MDKTLTKLMFDDSCRVLEEVGVYCDNKEIIDLLESTQLTGYDSHTNRIHITRDLIKICLDATPRKSKFPIPNRSFGPGGIAAFVEQGDDYIECCIDTHMGEIARIAQEFQLPFIFRSVGINLTPLEEVKSIDIIKKYYSGYIYVRVESDDGIWRVKLENDISGKICTTHSILLSPLRLNNVNNNITIFLKCIKYGIPIYLTTMPMTCLTGPATLYGIGILSFAEFLFGLCLCQIVNPGIIVVNGAFPTATDPRQNYSSNLGSIYHNLVNHTVARMSEEQDIPSIQSGCTISTEKHDPNGDWETERGYKLWNTWSDWHQLRHTTGFVNNLISFNFDKMRRDCKLMKRVVENNELYQGDIDELVYDAEAVDVISDCAENGIFKDHNHTLKNMGILK